MSSYVHTASFSMRTSKYAEELKKNADLLCTAGKGILAADESTGTIGKRLANIEVENTQANRKAYRKLLFTAPEEMNNYVSGVIMFEESFYETMEDGTTFAAHLAARGIIPGIKLDKGVELIPGTDDEKITKGLDSLNARAAQFYADGGRFAKWRNVLRISANTPSQQAIEMNAEILARYAALCQINGLVPIVEPEILMDGDHDIVTAAEVTRRVLACVFKKLADHGVYLQGCLLKPNMVVPGADCPKKATPADVGYYTVRTLQETVPPALPGVFFLSGGQSEEQATLNLNGINAADLKRPWHLTFSYGRALQHSVLKAWKGKEENIAAAHAVLITRAKANSQAQLGQYVAEGAADAQESLYQRNYTY